MFKREIEKQLYFSTKKELKTNGVVYRPSICYKVPEIIKNSLKKYAEETGAITFYTERVRFVNGIAVPVNIQKNNSEVRSIVETVGEIKTSKKRNK